MFGIIADLISSVVTILFPIFASYKALRTSSLAQVAPWLMYWVVLSIVLLIESWTVFIIGWIPFYSWIRLFSLSYLVLPQTQGATRLYLEQVEPFLAHHEREIEHFVARTHDRARAAGLEQLYKIIDLVRERALGLPPAWSTEDTGGPAPAGGAASYAQAIFSRFNIPTPAATSPGELFSLLSSTLASGGAPENTRDVRGEGPDVASRLFPRDIAEAPRAEQARYITSLRKQLGDLLTVVDREQEGLALDRGAPLDGVNDDLAYGTSYDYDSRGLRKNQSEHSFENIDHDDIGISTSLDRDDDVYYERRRSRRR